MISIFLNVPVLISFRITVPYVTSFGECLYVVGRYCTISVLLDPRCNKPRSCLDSHAVCIKH